MNSWEIPTFAQSFVRSGNSLAATVPKRVGDIPLGQWLQKFAANNGSQVNFKWGNPKSKPTYGHTFTEHGMKKKANQLIDRARAKGHQIGQWLDEKGAAKFIADVAKKGTGVHEVSLPKSLKNRGFLPDGTEIKPDMARVVVKENGGVKTVYPFSRAYPSGKGQ